MIKITEGEIQSLIRRFLLINKFQLVTRTSNGETLHYRTELTKPPKFKIPDHVAIKNNTVLVVEEKVRYSDLFKNKASDINKLLLFLNNKYALGEFKELLKHLNPPLMNPNIVGAYASLEPSKSRREIPSNFIYMGIGVTSDAYVVKICQDGNLNSLFNYAKYSFTL